LAHRQVLQRVAHRQVLQRALQMEPDLVFLVGDEFRKASRYLKAEKREGLKAFEDSAQAGWELSKKVRPGDAILLKGSRGMKIEKALIALQNRKG